MPKPDAGPEDEFNARGELMAALLDADTLADKALPDKRAGDKNGGDKTQEERGRRRRFRGPRRTVVVRLACA